jgi:hypothetical protein
MRFVTLSDRIDHSLSGSLWRGMTSRGGQLVLVALLTLLVVGPLSYLWFGLESFQAALVANGICLAASIVAALLGELPRGENRVLYGMLLGTLFRMGIPLLAGLALDQRYPSLAEAGVMYYLIFFYLVILAADTWLSVELLKSSLAPPKAN